MIGAGAPLFPRWPHLRCEVTAFASVFAALHLCLRRLTFFCLARKKSAKKRRRTRFDFYRTATTEAPKFVTSCKRTNSPKKNYVCPARQSDSPNLQVVASEAVPTIPTASKTTTAPTYSPKLPSLRTNSRQNRATAKRLAPQQARNKSGSRLRRNRTAVQPPSVDRASGALECTPAPRGIIQKGGPRPPCGRWGIVKGAIRKAPLTAFLYTAGGAFFPRGKERGAEPPP